MEDLRLKKNDVSSNLSQENVTFTGNKLEIKFFCSKFENLLVLALIDAGNIISK